MNRPINTGTDYTHKDRLYTQEQTIHTTTDYIQRINSLACIEVSDLDIEATEDEVCRV